MPGISRIGIFQKAQKTGNKVKLSSCTSIWNKYVGISLWTSSLQVAPEHPRILPTVYLATTPSYSLRREAHIRQNGRTNMS